METSPRFLRREEVLARTGLSKSDLYARVSIGTFPQPYDIGKRAVAWLEAEIDQWIRDTVAAAKNNPAAARRKADAKERWRRRKVKAAEESAAKAPPQETGSPGGGAP
jgi:prophage regulatory protein